MTILATNKATNEPTDLERSLLVNAVLGFIAALTIIWMTVFVVPHTIPGFWWFALFSTSMALFCAFVGLACIDNYLRNNRVVETVSVENGTLVIDCRGSIFRHLKEIPLNKIIRVDNHFGFWLLINPPFPERLKVVYSGSHCYRFGICLTDEKRDFLAKTIMTLADEYK